MALIRWRAENDKDPVTYLRASQSQYGDIFHIDDGVIFIGHPSLIGRVLARTNKDSVPDADPLVGGRCPDQEQRQQWMEARRIATPVFRPAALNEQTPKIEDRLSGSLQYLSKGGGWFSPAEDAWRISLRLILGLYLPREDTGIERAIFAAFEGKPTGAVSRIPGWFPNRRRVRAQQSRQQIAEEVDRLLERTPREPGQGVSVLEQILGGPELPPRKVAHNALGIAPLRAMGALGGAWCWLFYWLAAQPQVVELIRSEAASAQNNCTSDALPYTFAFIKEILRTRPPAWLVGRDCISNFELGGYHVEKGSTIVYSPYLVHHDERWWENPATFTPSRWEGDSRPEQKYAYLPFGGGPRGCLGVNPALTILAATAVELATKYRLEASDPDTVINHFGSTLLPHGLRCRITPTL
ncbi:cytochrome P450 [Streptomyces sp. NPDC053431]|uniref:cytochrome P450 n=1 Tax=Streptomyces sp. NPDC053431 TaxID=3365703 RepID=UPI0037D5899B